MKQLVVLFVALTIGIVVFGMPAESQAQVTVSNVTVAIGGTTISPTWTSQAINAGQTLVLAQNSGFNFDSSDTNVHGTSCGPATVSGTGFSFVDTKLVLTPIGCPGSTIINEAQNYTQIGSFTSNGLLITVSVGYADDAHSDPCGSDVPNGAPSCFPSPFATATFNQGIAAASGACSRGATCFDSGVILFKATAISTNACPLTQGFWKNHFPGAWPHSVIANGLKIGSKTYTAAELEANLETPPSGGNALLILSHQLIAAKLNILNGSDSTPIAATITAADAAIDGLNINVDFVASGSPLGMQMTALADTLDSYNSSLLTPTCTGPQ
jgi:hypothetical protein